MKSKTKKTRNTIFREGLFLAKKTYKGGGHEFQFILNKKHIECFGDWEELLSYLGEETMGGHNHGWNLNVRRIRKQRDNIEMIKVL